MNIEPKISRDLYLLSLNPRTGYPFNWGAGLGYGLLGSFILDLYRTGKIGIQNKKIVLINSNTTNYILFDEIIAIIKAKAPISMGRLLFRIGYKGNFLKKELIKILIANNDIIRVNKNFIGISYNRYFIKNNDYKTALVCRIRDILLRGYSPTPEEMLLLPIIHFCSLYSALSD